MDTHLKKGKINLGERTIMAVKKVEKKPAKKAEPKKVEKKPAKKVEPKKAEKKPAPKQEEKKVVTHRNYHVVKRPDGKWEVKYAGGEKAIKLFKTQAEAVEFTKKMADNQGGVMLVHNSKGANKGRIKSK